MRERVHSSIFIFSDQFRPYRPRMGVFYRQGAAGVRETSFVGIQFSPHLSAWRGDEEVEEEGLAAHPGRLEYCRFLLRKLCHF